MSVVTKKLIKPTVKKGVKKSTLNVFDIDIELIDASEENPNEEDDATFDDLVESVRAEGIDEPCIVVPRLDALNRETGRYWMASGYHRCKAARVIGLKQVPCVVKQGWDDDKRKIELVKRNILRGSLNPEKFTKLYNDIAKRYDKELLKKLMGFTKSDAFDKVYMAVEKSLGAKQKQKLAEAKETIKSVDDLSSVLNTIFKEHGSELSNGFLVFSFGGKNHHYVAIDAELEEKIKKVEKKAEKDGVQVKDVLKQVL